MNTWGLRRHLVQGLVLAAFFLTPVQLDFTEWRIHFFGMTLVPGLFHIFFIAALLPFFGIFALSALFNKLFCGWMCPQNIFYELFGRIQTVLKKYFPAFRRSLRAQKLLDLALAVICGLVIAGYSLTYFKGAHPLFEAGWFTILFSFFVYDIHWLKHKFCESACPYAFIQKAFATKTSLHIAWENRPGNVCGTCQACEKACYVNINPRQDAFHIDCTQCGACIDACDRVFERSGKPSLLRFAFEERKPRQWLGLASLPKLFVVLSFIAFLSILCWAVVSRPMLSFRVDHPAGGQAHQLPYTVDGQPTNRFYVRIRNLTTEATEYSVHMVEPDFQFIGPDKLAVKPLDSLSSDVEVRFTGTASSNFIPVTFELVGTNGVVGRQSMLFRIPSTPPDANVR